MVGWGDAWGGDFVLRGPNPFLKSYQIIMCPCHHMVESSSLEMGNKHTFLPTVSTYQWIG